MCTRTEENPLCCFLRVVLLLHFFMFVGRLHTGTRSFVCRGDCSVLFDRGWFTSLACGGCSSFSIGTHTELTGSFRFASTVKPQRVANSMLRFLFFQTCFFGQFFHNVRSLMISQAATVYGLWGGLYTCVVAGSDRSNSHWIINRGVVTTWVLTMSLLKYPLRASELAARFARLILNTMYRASWSGILGKLTGSEPF